MLWPTNWFNSKRSFMAYLTDQELLERFEYYTLQLEAQLLEGEDFTTLGDQIPFGVQLSHSKTLEIMHANKKYTELTGYTLDEMREIWPEYLKQNIHPSTFNFCVEFLPEFYAKNNPHQTTAFLQYVKLRGDSDYSAAITFTKPAKSPNDPVLWLSLAVKSFGNMSKQVEQIVRMDQFKLKHFKQFQQLTDRELEVLSLLANGLNNPKIADKLFLSRQTVETHRKNLKRKLELRSFRDLMRYAFAFNLVEV